MLQWKLFEDCEQFSLFGWIVRSHQISFLFWLPTVVNLLRLNNKCCYEMAKERVLGLISNDFTLCLSLSWFNLIIIENDEVRRKQTFSNISVAIIKKYPEFSINRKLKWYLGNSMINLSSVVVIVEYTDLLAISDILYKWT